MLADSPFGSLLRRLAWRRPSPPPAEVPSPPAAPPRKLDLALWITGGLAIASLVAFAAYYYYDRYYHPDEKILDREAQHIEAMVQKDPQNAGLRVSIAAFYMDKGLTDLAIQQCQEALKIDPKQQGALLVLGRAYTKKGEFDQAVASYQTLLDLNKDNQFAKMDSRLEGVYYELAKLYERQGKQDQSIASLKQALEIDSTDADARYLLATLYQKRNDHQAAILELQEALRFDPFFADAYQALAASYSAQGKAPEATYAEAMVSLSNNRFSEAASKLESVTQQAPGLIQAYMGLGIAYEKLGKRDQAIAALEKYLQAYPNDIVATQAMARLNKEATQR